MMWRVMQLRQRWFWVALRERWSCRFWRWVARRVPARAQYFVVIDAAARASVANPEIEVPAITWAEMADVFEVAA